MGNRIDKLCFVLYTVVVAKSKVFFLKECYVVMYLHIRNLVQRNHNVFDFLIACQQLKHLRRTTAIGDGYRELGAYHYRYWNKAKH